MATALEMVLTEPKVRRVEMNVFMIMISRAVVLISGAKGLQHFVLLSSENGKLWGVLELCYIIYRLPCNRASVKVDASCRGAAYSYLRGELTNYMCLGWSDKHRSETVCLIRLHTR